MTTTINASTSAGLVNTADTSGVLALQTAGTTAVTVDASQNVGIGTASPAANLHVSSSGNTEVLSATTGANYTTFRLKNSTNDYSMQIRTDVSNAWVLRDETAGANRLVVDTSGNVGIGTSTLTSGVRLISYNATNGGPATSGTTQASGAFRIQSGNNAACDFGVNGTTTWIQAADQTGLNTNYDIAMQPNGGNLLVGTTSNSLSTKLFVSGSIGAQLTYGPMYYSNENNTDNVGRSSFNFQRGGSIVGQIVTTNSTCAYNSVSDYRLKENIAPMTGALAKVAQLKPVTYKWNADGSDGQGFIAHELQEVVPDCVTGEKDAVETYTDEDGNEATRPAYQGIDTSFLVATLTAAIQEQQALIIQLQADVAALKGATP
jgi:hypothetical protein